VPDLLDLVVGGPAHGGACLARWQGRVVFVRHALPGERVRARVTEDRAGSFLRADAVEILDPAPGRVSPPCPYAGPGRCGGCDWQHADPALQRELKLAVVREQFRRLARTDVTELLAAVEELPSGPWAGAPGSRTGWTRAAGRACTGTGRTNWNRSGAASSACRVWATRTA
jgi:tRNA/tmRNA/rRNA uracil-C5-methylase (TrmA/RlmC/RlmD family)